MACNQEAPGQKGLDCTRIHPFYSFLLFLVRDPREGARAGQPEIGPQGSFPIYVNNNKNKNKIECQNVMPTSSRQEKEKGGVVGWCVVVVVVVIVARGVEEANVRQWQYLRNGARGGADDCLMRLSGSLGNFLIITSANWGSR